MSNAAIPSPEQAPGDEVPASGLNAKLLRPRHVTMISLGGIIGAGLFVGSGAAIAAAGPAILLSYLIAGLIVLVVMRALGEMAMADPNCRSFTEHPRRVLGSWAGFLGGWLYWYFWVVVVAIEAIAGAIILVPYPGWHRFAMEFLLLAVLTAANLLSLRAYGEFEFWFASIKVVTVVAFIGAASLFLAASPGEIVPVLSGGDWIGQLAPYGAGAVIAAITTVFFALCGAEIAVIAAADSEEPARAISRIALTLTIRVTLFFVLSISAILLLIPWQSVVPGESPFIPALARMGVPGAAQLMALVILTAVLSCLNSGLYITARVLTSLATAGDAPAMLASRGRTPRRAVLASAFAAGLVLLVSGLSPGVGFEFLVNACGATMLIVYLLVAVAQVRDRALREARGERPAALRMWLHPWLALTAITVMLLVLASMALDPSMSTQFVSSMAAAAFVLAAFCVRSLFRRSGRMGAL